MSTSSPTSALAAKPRRRLLRLVVRAMLILVAVVGLYAAYLSFDEWQARREWVEACAEADRLDPGWRWEDLLARMPAVPDEQNSAVRLLAAQRLLPSGWPTSQAVNPRNFGTPPTQRLSPELADSLRQVLRDIAPAVDEARAVADCPIGRVRPLASLSSSIVVRQNDGSFDYFAPVRTILQPLVQRHVEDGELDEALVTVRAIVYAARPLADSPMLLNVLLAEAERYIAAMAIERVLGQGEPSPAALDSLRRVIEEDVNRPLFLNALRGTRAGLEDLIRALDEGRVSRAQIAASGFSADPLFGGKLTGWTALDDRIRELAGTDLRRSTSMAALRNWTWAIERLKESPDGLKAHAVEWEARRSELPRSARIVVANITRYVTDFAIDDAYFRAAVVAVAAEHFRQVRGRWPMNLDELVPEFLIAVPRDPQDLRPLRLARLADGIAIYSVGPDGKDDGGDVGQGMSTKVKGRDIGIRLWDVDKRRQPAPQ